jgi:hypothetical protein
LPHDKRSHQNFDLLGKILRLPDVIQPMRVGRSF